MKIISKRIAGWLFANKVISIDEKELYEYAAFSFMMTLFPVVVIILFGIFMNNVVESVFIITPFMILRKFSGGYHAKHSWICMIFSITILFACVYISKEIEYCTYDVFGLLVSDMSLVAFSPIDSENRRLDFEEKKKYKIRTSQLVILFTMIYCLLSMVNKKFSFCVMEGIVLTACLQIPCVIIKICSLIKEKRPKTH